METTSENIKSVPIEGTEMFTFKPSPPPRNYTTGEIADAVAKLALKKVKWYILAAFLLGLNYGAVLYFLIDMYEN